MIYQGYNNIQFERLQLNRNGNFRFQFRKKHLFPETDRKTAFNFYFSEFMKSYRDQNKCTFERENYSKGGVEQ